MLVDDRGRIAGRFNLVDIAAAVLLFLIVPLAVGAYLLFRTPPPTLDNVTPKMLVEGPGQRLEIDGTNLRPFLRVSFNSTPAASFLLGSTTYALVDVPELAPGVYDVVLFDYAREVARLPKAVTIARVAADAELEVDGAFKDASDAVAALLKVGAKLPSADQPIADVIAVGAPSPGAMRLRVGTETVTVPTAQRDLPATLHVRCTTAPGPDGIARCTIPGPAGRTVLAPDALLTFSTPTGAAVFQVTAARAAKPGGVGASHP
jgi:IPT/TIG domain-containing protein